MKPFSEMLELLFLAIDQISELVKSEEVVVILSDSGDDNIKIFS